MIKKICILLLLQISVITTAQKRIAGIISNVRYVTDVPQGMAEIPDGTDKFVYNAGCGDHLFWQVVNIRLQAVPQLISMVDDMTVSQAKLPSRDGYYRTGDVALIALKEIIHNIPLETLSGLKMADFAAPYYFYEQGLKDKATRTALKEALLKWYSENQKAIIFKKGQSYGNCDCFGKHPVGGAYYFEER
ncbi:hypothetical protein ACLI09_13090 [Flavobacterium sp. RHBU_24]|uniref:hypothetical protein n=1 Tax=Flavobacterium sp. RHBU_24 TaxID=3391185 RepID=UPI003984FA35